MAAAAALFLRTPETPETPADRHSGFVAKGAGDIAFRASCPGRPDGECRVGDRLIFEIEGAKNPGVFGGYAECAAGERIWYFPTATGELPAISGNGARTVIDRAARIGQEHGLGTCVIHLFALERAVPRSALVTGGIEGSSSANLSIEVKP